jgi:hypothetical protein
VVSILTYARAWRVVWRDEIAKHPDVLWVADDGDIDVPLGVTTVYVVSVGRGGRFGPSRKMSFQRTDYEQQIHSITVF